MVSGIVLLVGITVLIFVGLAEQALDRLYLSDRSALLIIGALIAGSFIDIPIWRNPPVSLNVGGAVIPLVLAIYVLSRAGSHKEWMRSLIGIVITTGVLYGINKLYNFDVSQGFIEPQYLWGVVAGGVAYIAGRSRRLAFIIATLGVLAMDIIHVFETMARGVDVPTRIGGAGAFDTIIIAGILGLILAEIIGESREALQGGPVKTGRPDSLVEALDHPVTRKTTEKEEKK